MTAFVFITLYLRLLLLFSSTFRINTPHINDKTNARMLVYHTSRIMLKTISTPQTIKPLQARRSESLPNNSFITFYLYPYFLDLVLVFTEAVIILWKKLEEYFVIFFTSLTIL